MRYIKSLLIILVCSFLCLTAYAVGGHKLFILLIDGKSDAFLLKEKPVVTFDGESVHIKSAQMETTMPYKYKDVEKFYFDVVQDEIIDSTQVDPKPVDPDAIDELKDENKPEQVLTFAYDGRTVQIKGLGNAPKVAVFNTTGVRMQPRMNITSTAVTFSVADMPAGIYVVRADDRSFKIIKK